MIPPKIDWVGLMQFILFGAMLWIFLVIIMAM